VVKDLYQNLAQSVSSQNGLAAKQTFRQRNLYYEMRRREVADIQGTARHFAVYGWDHVVEERRSWDLAGLTGPNERASLLADMSLAAHCSFA